MRTRLLALFLAPLAAVCGVPATAGATHAFEADPGFGEAGQSLVAGLSPAAVVARPGGLLVLEPGSFGVAAVTSAGRLDLAFGDAGRTAVTFARSDARPRAVAVDAKGRIVVVGSASYEVPHTPATHGLGHPTAMAAARFFADGTPDAGFGTGGVVLLPFPDGASVARSTVVLPDGGVVLAGSAQDGDVTAVALLDDAGRPDTRFGSGGRIVVEGGPGSEGARAVVPVAHDRLLVAGVTSTSDAYAIRLTRTGPDPGFGDGGVFALRGTAGDTAVTSAIAAADGRLLLPGRFLGRPGVLALDQAGRVDASYGDRGVAEVETPAGLHMLGVVRATLDGAGRLSQTWSVLDRVTRRSHLLVQRYDTAGRPEGDGASVDVASAVTVNPVGILDAGAGSLLILGRAHGPGDAIGAAMARLRPAGAHPAPRPRRCKRIRRPRSRGAAARCKRPSARRTSR